MIESRGSFYDVYLYNQWLWATVELESRLEQSRRLALESGRLAPENTVEQSRRLACVRQRLALANTLERSRKQGGKK